MGLAVRRVEGRKVEARSTAEVEGVGLRERKAARTRIAVVRALDARLATTALADISVEQLAADANISRMTFFNYFPTKEHAVDLLMIVFLYELRLALVTKRLRGVAALDHVFAVLGDDVARAPDKMRQIHAYFASRPGDRPLPELGKADREALVAGSSSLVMGPMSLGALFMELVEEAVERGEIALEGSSYELAHFLGALATGSALIGHSSPDTDWPRLFRRHVRRALGLLADRRAAGDPKPPRVPAAYRKRSKP